MTCMTENEREAFEERAAIAEFDGGMTRDEAEALALEAVIRRRGNTQPATGESHGTASDRQDPYQQPHQPA